MAAAPAVDEAKTMKQEVKLDSKYGPASLPNTKPMKLSPTQIRVTAEPPTSPIHLSHDSEDDENYWGDLQPQDHEVPTWPDDEPEIIEMVDDDGGPTLHNDSLEMKVLREGARAALIRDYVWAEDTKRFVNIPQSFQDAVPMTKRERKDLLKGIPENFNRVFPCRGPRALSVEDRQRVRWWNELWFLEKGAPRLHGQMVDQLRALTYLAQECGEAPERIGLSIDELRVLLRKIITIHVDTMKLLAHMQVKRALLATNRGSGAKDTDPEQLIISEKRRESEVKRAESRLAVDINARRPLLKNYSKNKKPTPFGGLGTRRHRQPTQATSLDQPRLFAHRGGATRGYFRTRGRGRGRGFRGGSGRGQTPQL